jgi:ATP-dependent RNA helicase RhlE
MELLDHTDTESVLIFARTKHRVKRLGEQLEKAGYSVASLQGNLSQNRRQSALDGFRDGKYQILVATDIAARGIDVTRISHVINYDIPNTTDAYTHRIGRTGRAAKTGDAYTLISEEDTLMVRSIERALGAKVERRIVKGFDYSQPAPQRNNEFARPPREPRGRRPQAPRSLAPQSPTPSQQSHPHSQSPTPSNGRLILPVSSPTGPRPSDRPAQPRSNRPSEAASPNPNASHSRRHRRPRSTDRRPEYSTR